MKKQDPIEHLFERLRDFSEVPPEELWGNIETKLHPKKKKKKGLFLWGVAVSLILLVSSYLVYQTAYNNGNVPIRNSEPQLIALPDSIQEHNIINPDKQHVIVEINSKRANNKNKYHSSKRKTQPNIKSVSVKTEAITSIEKSESVAIIEQKPSSNPVEAQKITMNKSEKIDTLKMNSENNAIANNSDSKQEDLLKTLEDAIAKNEDDKTKEIKDSDNRSNWAVQVLGGIANTTASASNFQNVAVGPSSENSIVFGVRLKYNIHDKWSIITGVSQNNLGQKLNAISYKNIENEAQSDNIQSITENSNLFISADSESLEIALLDASLVNSLLDDIQQGELEQQLNYIEIPLEISYQIMNKEKYSLSLKIGGNINILTKNQAFINQEHIGKNANVNSTIFGASISPNIGHELLKNITLFLEPSYNYYEKPINNQLQSFDNSQFRVQIGVQYQF